MREIKRIVFLGDSITMGYGLAEERDRFSTVFCDMTGTEEINYGITGTQIARAGLSAEDGTSFIDRYRLMEDGDMVVVFGSTNDYFWTDTPPVSDSSDDDRFFSNAARHLGRGLKERYPGIPIIFILPYQMKGIGKIRASADGKPVMHDTDQPNQVGCPLSDYVEILKQICLEENLLVLDLFHNFSADIAHSGDDEARYTLDGCHPNSAGHKLIAESLLAFCIQHRLLAGKKEMA